MSKEDAAVVINKDASVLDLYDAISQRVQMARGFCLVVAQDENISSTAETAGHAQSAWGHSELLQQADDLLKALWERIRWERIRDKT